MGAKIKILGASFYTPQAGLLVIHPCRIHRDRGCLAVALSEIEGHAEGATEDGKAGDRFRREVTCRQERNVNAALRRFMSYSPPAYLARASLVFTTFMLRPSSLRSMPMARPRIWVR